MSARWIVGILMLAMAQACLALPVALTVVDAASGGPVAGARVALLSPTPLDRTVMAVTMISSAIGTTDAQGGLGMEVNPRLRVCYEVVARDHAPCVFSLAGAVPSTLRLPLAKADHRLTGHVMNNAGKALAGVNVRALASKLKVLQSNFQVGMFPVRAPLDAVTDDSGKFSFDASTDMNVDSIAAKISDQWQTLIMLSKATTRPLSTDSTLRDETYTGTPGQAVAELATENAALTMDLTVHLRVVDAQTHQPVPGVRVWAGQIMNPSQPVDPGYPSDLILPGEETTWTFFGQYWAYLLRVEAPGYAAAPTRKILPSEREATVEIALAKARPIALTVLTPDGKPAAGAKVLIATPTMPVHVCIGTSRWPSKPDAIADAQGVVHFDAPSEPYRLAIYDDSGQVEYDPQSEASSVKLLPWAHVTVNVGAPGTLVGQVEATAYTFVHEEAGCPIDWEISAQIKNGGQSAENIPVPAGALTVSVGGYPEVVKLGWSSARMQCKATERDTLTLTFLAGSATLHASLAAYPGLVWRPFGIERLGPSVALPGNINELPWDKRYQTVEEAMSSVSGRLRPNIEEDIGPYLPDDGTISLAGMSPGTYMIIATLQPEASRGGAATRPAAPAPLPPPLRWIFEVPDGVATIDLGLLHPPVADGSLLVGQDAPALKAALLSGANFDLAAQRGKWVLVEFWGTWCGICLYDEPQLKDAYDGWVRDGRLQMVGISVDDTAEAVRAHIAKEMLAWPQIVLGDSDKTDVPHRFGVDGYPSIFLIGPDGKIVDNTMTDIHAALTRQLGPAARPAP